MKCTSITSPKGVPFKGLALIPALFLVVALAALGTAMLYFSSAQHLTHAYDLLGSQALAAARAGVEWAAAQIKAGGCPASTTLNGAPLFPAFTVTVTCQSDGPFTDEGKNVVLYRVTATANTGGAAGQPGFVERQVEAVIAKEE